MAILTKTEKYVAETYAKYFGRAADADTIKAYGLKENGKAEKASVILANIIAAADAEKTGLEIDEFVNNAFQNLFGRNANTKEMSKYSKVVDAGKDLPINAIVKSAVKADKDVYNNKLEVAAKYAELGGKGDLDLSKISKGNLIKDIKTVTKLDDLLAKYEALAGNSNGIPSSFDGKTFILTEGVDAGKDFTGTNKGDLFIADNTGTKANASAADTLDGGKGVDTFKLYDNGSVATASTTQSLPTLKNIENVVIYDNKGTGPGAPAPTTVDLTKWDTVETLSLVRSTFAGAYDLGEKVTTVNIEDKVVTANTKTTLNFDDALAAATLGLNKVTVNGAVTNTISVDGAALKTLTVDAYGKDSIVTLTQAGGAAIETLNITGRADLTLALTAGGTDIATTVKTVDGSKAEGNLTLTNTTSMTSIKTGSGNDKVTVAADVTFGETINLGAGNDKLVADTGAIAAGSIIDGGAGIDSLDADLVNVGNAGVFASFETISLNAANTASPLDLDLLTKSTITSIAKDGANSHALLNVKKSQALTVNTAGAANTTTLGFKASEIAGTADAYTINFNANNAGALNAGTVTIDGIETVTVNSVGKTGATNTITLEDKAAKSLVITGDKDLTVNFATAFGDTTVSATDGLGVSTIDASASTAGIKITDLVKASSKLNVAAKGLTIKGGAGDDNITTGAITKATVATLTIDSGAGNDTLDLSAIAVADLLTKADIKVNAGAGDDKVKVGFVGGTFTLGAGKDTIDVTNATVATTTTVAGGAIKTTITDIEKGDKIVFHATTSNLFAKATITGANNLDEALGLAATGTGANTTWFQYSGKTYIVHNNANTALETTDIVVELNGVVDLGNSALAAGTLTIA